MAARTQDLNVGFAVFLCSVSGLALLLYAHFVVSMNGGSPLCRRLRVILGLYWDNGKENGNYRDYRGYIGIIG